MCSASLSSVMVHTLWFQGRQHGSSRSKTLCIDSRHNSSGGGSFLQCQHKEAGKTCLQCFCSTGLPSIVHISTDAWIPACVQALRSSSEELSRILDIVGRYSVYKADVAFSCKRQVRTISLQCSKCLTEVKQDCNLGRDTCRHPHARRRF